MGQGYQVSSRDYLARAEAHLSREMLDTLFYAAFELRCGIESRMQEYLDAWDHIADSKKKGWRIVDLARNIESEFRTGDTIIRWAVKERDTGKNIVIHYHTPVTSELRKLGEKLGNYMHAMKRQRADEDPWWAMFKDDLRKAADALRVANTGTLLGPPLQRKGSKRMQTNIEVMPGRDDADIVKKLTGQSVTVDVKYLNKLPDPLEPEASVWVFPAGR